MSEFPVWATTSYSYSSKTQKYAFVVAAVCTLVMFTLECIFG